MTIAQEELARRQKYHEQEEVYMAPRDDRRQQYNGPRGDFDADEESTVVPAGAMWPGNTSDRESVLALRREHLPAIALLKLKMRGQHGDRLLGLQFAKQTRVQQLREQRDEVRDQKRHLEKHAERTANQTKAEEKLVADLQRREDKLTRQIRELTNPAATAKLGRERAAQFTAMNQLGPTDVDEFLLSVSPGTELVECRASLPEGVDFREEIARLRTEILEVALAIHNTNVAPLTVAEQKQAIRRDVELLAIQGRPDLTRIARLRQTRLHGAPEAGSIVWPERKINSVTYTGSEQLQLGNAMVAWLFRDELTARLEREIDATDLTGALSRNQRKKLVAGYEKELLALMRREERLLTELEMGGDFSVLRDGAGPRPAMVFLEVSVRK